MQKKHSSKQQAVILSRRWALRFFPFMTAAAMMLPTLSRAHNPDTSTSHARSKRHLQYEVVDVPFEGASDTQIFGINNAGDIVGSYLDSEGIRHGFVRRDGEFDSITGPGSTNTRSFGINDWGEVTGIYRDADNPGLQHGYILECDGTFTDVDFPNQSQNYAWGINNAGQITGYYFEFPSAEEIVITSFLRDSDGTLTVVPSSGGAGGNVFRGINDRGHRAGWNLPETGFVFNELITGLRYKRGRFKSFSVPEGRHTLPNDINNRGVIVGHAASTDFSNTVSFKRRRKGRTHLFQVPQAETTVAQGINDRGLIAGWFEIHHEEGEEEIHETHGFIGRLVRSTNHHDDDVHDDDHHHHEHTHGHDE